MTTFSFHSRQCLFYFIGALAIITLLLMQSAVQDTVDWIFPQEPKWRVLCLWVVIIIFVFIIITLARAFVHFDDIVQWETLTNQNLEEL